MANDRRKGVDSPDGQPHGKDPQVVRVRQEALTARLDDYELIAQKLSDLSEQVSRLENRTADVLTRMADVEKVNARLEEAALITARALQEISGHWDAVYEAMRRKDASEEAPEH
jgi:transcriptional accessory protein Tex/SPT6